MVEDNVCEDTQDSILEEAETETEISGLTAISETDHMSENLKRIRDNDDSIDLGQQSGYQTSTPKAKRNKGKKQKKNGKK